MPLAHRIALKGPWRNQWIDDASPNLAARAYETLDRVQMPTSWQAAFGERAGRVRFLRRLHAPTGIEAGDRVVLCFSGVGGSASFQLNERVLGGAAHCTEAVSFDITPLLEPSNMLEVVIDFDPRSDTRDGGLWGTVFVEIHSAE